LNSISYGADIFVDFSVMMRTQIVASRCVSYAQNMPTMRLRPGLRPGPHWGSLHRSPRPRWVNGEGLPGMGPPEGGTPRKERRRNRRGKGGGRGKLLPPDVRFYG